MPIQLIIKTYPFLEQLPEDILSSVDLNVLCIPDEKELSLLHALEEQINKYLVIYNNRKPFTGHLCREIQAASLTHFQITLLQTAEKRLQGKNKILVAYEKPLILASRKRNQVAE